MKNLNVQEIQDRMKEMDSTWLLKGKFLHRLLFSSEYTKIPTAYSLFCGYLFEHQKFIFESFPDKNS